MSDTYIGWDGKSYPWPPPEGWYHASDGRWWAPATGPNPPSPGPDTAAPHHPEASLGNAPTTILPTQTARYLPGGEQQVGGPPPGAPRVGPGHSDTVAMPPIGQQLPYAQPPSYGDSQSLGQQPPNYAPPQGPPHGGGSGNSPFSAPLSTGFGTPQPGPQQAGPQQPGFQQPGPQQSGPQQPGFQQQPGRAPTGGQPYIPADYAPPSFPGGNVAPGAGRRSRGLGRIVAVLVAVVAVLALAAGALALRNRNDNGTAAGATTTTAGSATTAAGQTTTASASASTIASTTSTTATTTSTSTTLASDTATQVAQFRAILVKNGLTSDSLTDAEIQKFGSTFCVFAKASGTADDFAKFREQAIAQTVSSLDNQSLNLVINSAVVVFCPAEATRLGIDV